MSPMLHLIIASIVFLATHYIASTPLRDALLAVMGRAYLAVYVLIAFATLGWMIHAFYHAPYMNLWYAVSLRIVPLVVMPFALILLVCGVSTRNPTAVGQEKHLKSGATARGILRITRHPVMWSFALWSLSHMVARGDAASLIFFGTFGALALSGTWLIDRRKARANAEAWKQFAAVTSNLPFGAIAAGRNHFRPGELGAWKIVVALLVYAVLVRFHHALFGAQATL
jgi:uncharacterized membrane protein